MYFVAYSPDGKKYTTSARNEADRSERGFIWNAAAGKRPFVLDPPEEGIVGDTFSQDGKVIAGFSRGCVLLWDANNGKELHQFPTIGGLAARPTFSVDGKLLAAATNDTKTVKVWDVAGGNEVQSLQDDAEMSAVALSPDGRFLAAGHSDGTISLWDLSVKGGKKRTLGGHSARVNVLRFTPDGKTLVSSADDGTIRLWNPERERSLRELILLGPAKGHLIFDLDPSGRYLFAAGQTPVIFVLRLPPAGASPISEKPTPPMPR